MTAKPVKILLVLEEPKKSCGKYNVKGTENDRYPVALYLKNEWLNKVGGALPQLVEITIDSDPKG
jgi:hypothetical protein